jgi:protein SCO1/2
MARYLLFSLLIAVSLTTLAQEHGNHQHHQHTQPATPAWLAEGDLEQLLKAKFELLDGREETVTEQDFRGSYLLIGFGFSSCAHVCPTTLQNWARTVDLLPAEKAARLQVLMISLDPERDSPEHMDQFVKRFNPDFHGLSGSADQVARAAKNFRVTYHKVPVEESYQINHTSLSYLVDPRGEVIDYYGFGTPITEMANSLAGHILPAP